MITKKTVLVLGAGASYEYGLPLGKQLRDRIIQLKKRNSEKEIWDEYELEDFTEDLKESGFTSVDRYLEHRPHHLEIGKLAIAFVLLRAEQKRKLFPTNGWYEILAQAMEITEPGAFEQNLLSIITFNYDRTLEYFLYRILLNHAEYDQQKALERYNVLPIIHVHGSLGPFPVCQPSGIDFGQFSNSKAPYSIAAQNIKIITEAEENSPEFQKARKILWDAERIYFLGLSYDATNIRRLEVFNDPWDNQRRQRVKVCGTRLGWANDSQWGQHSEKIFNGNHYGRAFYQQDILSVLSTYEPLDIE